MDKNKAAVAVFDKSAQVYQDKFMDVSLYHASLDVFCSSIAKQGAHILELACGPGNITRYLLQQRPDLHILATDLAPNMLALAAANNPTAQFQLMDCRVLKNLDKTWDGIMCGFCLPYLSKEEVVQLIADAAAVLNEGGVLYLSTMEGDYSLSGPKTSSAGDELYQYYHEAGYLTGALTENGFAIEELQRISYMAGATAVTDLIIVAVEL